MLIGACGDASGPAAPPEAPTEPPPEPPQATCIPSGDQSAITQVLTRVGAHAVLCPGAVFGLKGPVVFTADSQRVYTEGLPTDGRRAILRIAEDSVWWAVDMTRSSYAVLSNVIVDGNRPQLGRYTGPGDQGRGTGGMITAGLYTTGQIIRQIKAFESRDWTVLHFIVDELCSNALVEENEIGPSGIPGGEWSDGISFGCNDSVVRKNTVTDATDVGIVIFGAKGSVIEDNVVRARTRTLLTGIGMADILGYGGNFTNTRVRRNVIDAQGDTIRVGMLMGRRVFECIPEEMVAEEPRLYGAIITDNRLEGDYMQYGFAVDGVRDWTVTGNIDNARHSGAPADGCNGQMPSPPAGFQKYSPRADGQFQAEFKEAYLHGALHSVMPLRLPCIPSGDQSAINQVLTRVGAHAVLCPGAVFELKGPVVFTSDSQQVYTEGLPTDDRRAILRIAEDSVWMAVDMTRASHAVLSNVIVDGNRPQLGRYTGPGDQFGNTHGMIVAGVSPTTGQIIRQIKALESRDWTVLHVIGGCTNALIEENEIGPSGVAGGEWSDGIAHGCNDSVVRKNTVTDATDVGIVIFGAEGSVIEDNVIRARTRTLLTGIGMADILGYGGNFTNVRVRRNVIDAQGDTIRVGMLMGRRVFVCIPEERVAEEPRLYGAIITDNRLEGDYMQYGFAVDGVRDWTVTGNIDNARHSGTPSLACNGQMPSPPAGFQKYSPRADGQFQAEFKEAYLHGALHSVMPPRP
ncbi:MAG: right-handed parallel beta-helix repeat-containing protein [Gemmatimonadetes bacterium]|nr:right-handed parallel beta-helix repeat-containing protein [Gemmatimonadota bacterium]